MKHRADLMASASAARRHSRQAQLEQKFGITATGLGPTHHPAQA